MKHRGLQTPRKPASLSRGMTLLDTLVTVSVVGTASAVALPKLNDVPREARLAVVAQMAGAVRSAGHLVHMKCAVQANCDLQGGEGSVMVSGDEVRLLGGYPAAGTPEGIANAMDYTGFSAEHGAGKTWFGKDGAPDPQRCGVSYEAPEAPGQAPQVTEITSGC